MHEMWEEFKFAINWRAGDTKPIKTGSQSRLGSRSLLSKSNAESINKYGVIGDDSKSNKSRKDSTYATFNENLYGDKKWWWKNTMFRILYTYHLLVFIRLNICQTLLLFVLIKLLKKKSLKFWRNNFLNFKSKSCSKLNWQGGVWFVCFFLVLQLIKKYL